jgi:hypothetical protein
VWTRQERLAAVEFIQDPSEPVWNKAEWLLHVPADRPEAFENNLFHLQANRAYLVNLSGSAPVALNLTGRPSLRQPEWVPDAYNLRGLPVDPAAPPTFRGFFRGSPAHRDVATGQLRRIYRLSLTGQWSLVAPTDLVAPGEAYWIYTKGGSDYVAPLAPKLAFGDGLDFGRELTELSLTLLNRTDGALDASLAAPAVNPLSYAVFDPANGWQWQPLPPVLTINNLSAANGKLRLAIRRQDMAGDEYGETLALTDGAGTRFSVAVTAQKETFSGAAEPHAYQASASGRVTKMSAVGKHGEPPVSPAAYAGLWLGHAVINSASEANSANPANLTPTKSEFKLRLLIHVDTNGVPRLLKEVLQMWKEGTFTNDTDGAKVLDQPGRYVLLTDKTLISHYHGATLRDGVEVGRRLSTIGFDFPSAATNNYLTLSGAFGVGANVSGALTLDSDAATNPFKHKYHPDHDNLDASFTKFRAEACEVTRAFALEFTATDTDGNAAPDYGYGVLAGNYQETISGLHKNPIVVGGTFRLSRVALIGTLNQ